MALSKWIRWLYFHGLGGSAAMEYSNNPSNTIILLFFAKNNIFYPFLHLSYNIAHFTTIFNYYKSECHIPTFTLASYLCLLIIRFFVSILLIILIIWIVVICIIITLIIIVIIINLFVFCSHRL